MLCVRICVYLRHLRVESGWTGGNDSMVNSVGTFARGEREEPQAIACSGQLAVTRRPADAFVVLFRADYRLKDLTCMGEWAAAERPSFRKPAVDGFRQLGGVGRREQLVFVYLAHRDPLSLLQAYLSWRFRVDMASRMNR